MAKPSYIKSPPSQPPADAVTGAAFVRAYMLKLYDRQDGEAADWKLIAETLFKAAFDAMDKLPDEACRSMARRVHEGSYGRVATVHLPYDTCISLLSNAESIYILFIVNTMNA